MLRLGKKTPAYQPPPAEVAEAEIAAPRAEEFKVEGDLTDREKYSTVVEPLLRLASERPIIVDATEATTLGYDFSRTLIAANRAQEQTFGYGNCLKLVVKDQQILQTLLMTGLDKLFRIYSTLEDAHTDTGRITAQQANSTK
ncbi:MAG: hypothetical protein J5J00_12010 [Deltaproteobacteria bacterium]|nr:hypothetical protein [Deltaproteobacteria bacterium]